MPPERDRRGRQGPPGAARQARVPARRRRPCVGREPPLHAHARTSPSRPTSSATTRSCTSLVELIVDEYDGSLKAEHGTGVNMAPFVEREWGAKATELMWRVKQLADPDADPRPGDRAQPRPAASTCATSRASPEIEESVTKCIECGFCEPVCPSAQPDHDAAPTDRAATRDGAPAERLAGAVGRC